MKKVKITRLVEESNGVIAEGTFQSKKKNGGPFKAVFCVILISFMPQI